MAIALDQKENTLPPSPTYPYGDILDDSGAGDGTPVNRINHADFHQFFSKMMDDAGVEYNDLPDNAVNGFQLFEAMLKIAERPALKNFNEDLTLINLSSPPTTVSRNFFVNDDGIFIVDKVANSVRKYGFDGVEIEEIGNGFIAGDADAVFVRKDNGKIYVASVTGTGYDIDVFESDGTYLPLESFSRTESFIRILDIYVDTKMIVLSGSRTSSGVKAVGVVLTPDGVSVLFNQVLGDPTIGAIADLVIGNNLQSIGFFHNNANKIFYTRFGAFSEPVEEIDFPYTQSSIVHYDSGILHAYVGNPVLPDTRFVTGVNPNDAAKLEYESFYQVNYTNMEKIFIHDDVMYLWDPTNKLFARRKRNRVDKAI